jgi:hypothetical protein
MVIPFSYGKGDSRMQSMKLAAVGLIALLLSSPVLAFRSTDVESFTDPDYQGYQPRKVMIVVESENQEMRSEIEERLTKALEKKGVAVVTNRRVFPPTRQYSAEEKLKVFEAQGIDSALIVTVGASASSVMQVATQTYGTMQVNSSGNSAYGSGNATSYGIYSAKSKAQFSAVLLDIIQNRAAWYADVLVCGISSDGDQSIWEYESTEMRSQPLLCGDITSRQCRRKNCG